MLLFAAAAIAALAPHPGHQVAAPTVQATATVRIVAGVRVDFKKSRRGEGFAARDTFIRSGASSEPARLIEFE